MPVNNTKEKITDDWAFWKFSIVPCIKYEFSIEQYWSVNVDITIHQVD